MPLLQLSSIVALAAVLISWTWFVISMIRYLDLFSEMDPALTVFRFSFIVFGIAIDLAYALKLAELIFYG